MKWANDKSKRTTDQSVCMHTDRMILSFYRQSQSLSQLVSGQSI